MKIQPITQAVNYKSKHKLRVKADALEKLDKLGVKAAVSGGLVLPPNAKPEVVAGFNDLMENSELKPLKSCISQLLNKVTNKPA